MTKVDHEVMGNKTEDDEITFADVLGFLRRNWKFLGLLTVVLSAAAVTLVLLLPKEYQKEVTLVTNLAPSELMAGVREQRELLPSQDQISNSAVSSLQDEDFGEVEVDPKYENPTKRINVVLRSRDADSLVGATPRIVSFLKGELQETYERDFDRALEMALVNAEREVQIKRGIGDHIEQASLTEEQASQVGVDTLVELAEAESERDELVRVREELPQLMDEAFSVDVLTDSDVQQSTTPAALILLAVAVGFAIAVTLTLAQEAFTRRK